MWGNIKSFFTSDKQKQYIDFNDILPPLASRGASIVPKYTPMKGELIEQAIPGRYLDPTSGRLDQLGTDYYRNPVDTWLYGKADFIHFGQKAGNLILDTPNIFHPSKEAIDFHNGTILQSIINQKEMPGAWTELKIYEPSSSRKDTCYTNLPARY